MNGALSGWMCQCHSPSRRDGVAFSCRQMFSSRYVRKPLTPFQTVQASLVEETPAGIRIRRIHGKIGRIVLHRV